MNTTQLKHSSPIATSVPDRHRSANLAGFALELQRARQDEREHLARELHDELGALLTVAKLDVARLKTSLQGISVPVDERLRHLSDTLNAGMALKSHLVDGLLPSSLVKLGLNDSVRALAREFGANTGIQVETHLEEINLDEASQLALYRLAQECLTNIEKYAGAREVWIDLLLWEMRIAMTVRDNGTGFDTMTVEKSHRGLVGMRERVEACGGELCVFSTPGKGTQVMALLPARRSQGKAGFHSLTAPRDRRACGSPFPRT
jgi:signal transduction histidine kinase